MIDPKYLRMHLAEVMKKLAKRGFKLTEKEIDELIQLEDNRKSLQVETQQLQNDRNKGSKDVATIKDPDQQKKSSRPQS